MGNKILRPNQLQPLSGFNDDQISYLKDKFQILCDETKLLNVQKIAQSFKCSRGQASKILNYIDFQNQGEVDFYEFTCAAASLHQNDEDAYQFLYDLYGNGKQLDQSSFDTLFNTIFSYLKFIDKNKEDYSAEEGQKKFKKYDYNNNRSIGFDEFKQMLKNDYHCRLWMENLGFVEERPEDPPQKPQNHENDDFGLQQGAGDQAGSTPSWIKTIQYMAPDNKAALQSSNLENPPNSNLDIQYVYGYRCYDTSDNLRYNVNTGEVIYHTAGCGIVLNKIKNTMRVNTAHNNDIISLAYNSNKNIVVTGEMGRKPAIIVWDATTTESLAVLPSKLQKNISNLAISKSGRFVAATSMADTHQIAIFDISNLNGNANSKYTMMAYGQGPKSVIHAVKFTSNEQEVVVACQKQVVFVKYKTGKIESKKGIFGKAPLAANYCIAVVGDAVVTGMGNGVLGYWKGNSCSRVYKEHSKPVTALCERQDGGLISGDTIGTIILWSPNLSKQREIQLNKLIVSNNPKIISLCEGFNNILVGTRGGEIVEIDGKKNSSNVVMQGHFDQQLWGMAVLPNKHQFITGGQDKLLIKWDSDKRKIIVKKKLQYSIASVDINNKNIVAVGHTNGVINLYDGTKLDYIKKIQTFKNPDKQVISTVKFSPNSSILAVGYCPPISQVYLYNVQNSTKIGQCKGSPSRIVSIDFSRDSNSIMINNTSYEILFYNTSNGSQVTTATTFKNEQFATMTSRFAWQTQGIWPPCSDGSDINSLDRSNSKKYLVTADDFSSVKLFKYPVCNKKQIYNKYKGHSSHVTNIKWMFDDKFVISTGGLEKSIIQWLFQDAPDINYDYQEKQHAQENQQQVEQQQYEIVQEGGDNQMPQQQQGQFGIDIDEGDQALAVKPFLGQVQKSTPLSFKTLNMRNIEPTQELKIKHVWGIRNQYIKDRVRDQLRYSSNYNSCIFITATLGVDMNLKTKAQTFYQGHCQDLISFAMTKDRKLCATGQMAEKNAKSPLEKIIDIHVWDADTKQRKAKLSGFHKRGVVILQFSPSGKRLLSVGQDDKNSLAAYDWEVNRVAWSAPVCGAKVTGAAWKNQQQYMTVGFKHVKLWKSNKGIMCKVQGKWDPMVSVVYWNDKFVSGGSEGALYLWTGSNSVSSKGHDGRVDCLRVDSNGALFSGCSNGIINKWKYSGGKLVLDTKILNMAEIDKFSPGILSIDFSPQNYLICTNSSTIYQAPKNNKSKPNIIMQSHYLQQLWAQAWSPNSNRFVTGGDDKTIRIYDANTFQMLHSYKTKQRIRGLDWQKSKGELIVVGDGKGKIYLFDTQLNLLDEAKTRFSKTKPRQQPFWIQDIKFSPNGQYVAFGAHGGATYIDIFQINGNDKKFGKENTIANLISSATLSVDWSQDSNNLAVVSQAYELQFVSHSGKVSASSMRDVKWATWTGKFGAYVKQIHQDVDYSNINAVDMSPTGQLIATGGDDQCIRLFKSPVILPKQKNKAFVGHSSHVTKIRFSADQMYLLSIGGNDRTIIMWEVLGREETNNKNKQGEEEQQEEEQNQGNEQADDIGIPVSRQQLAKSEQTKKQTNNQDQFQMQEQEGDQFMAVKPWLGAIKEPTTDYYKSNGKAPNVQLNLDYAYGYRCKDCRNNLIYLSENKIAYHTAGLGVIMNTSTNPKTQQFFNLHNDDIISMTWKDDKSAIFTGEMGAKPIIYQWNTEGNMVQKYKGSKKNISAIAISDKYVISACMDDDHHLYLFEVNTGKLLCSQKGGREFITAMRFVNQTTFVSVGVKHYKLWSIENGKSMKGKMGQFGKHCNILTSVIVIEDKVYTGASDGSLHSWQGNSISKSQKLHTKSLNALCCVNRVLLTGSSDCTVAILDISSLAELSRINCKQLLLDSINQQIVGLDALQNKIIVGTKGSEIYEIMSNTAIENSNQNSQYKLQGHYMSGHYAPNHVTNEVWGLAVKGNQDSSTANRYIVTCADDGTLRVWDTFKKEQATCVSLDYDTNLKPRQKKGEQKFLPDSCKGNSVYVSRSGETIVGCKDGTIRVYNSNYKPILVQASANKTKGTDKNRRSSNQISVLKLSPDESMLAVGDHNGRIAIYEWNRGKGKMKLLNNSIKHSSTIKNFDFSRDGNIIHSTCTSYELLFWDTATGKQITSGATSTRDEEWATWTVTLGWPVQGIWEQEMDGSDINAVDRSNKAYNDKGMKLLASSDDRGQVRLLQYPCVVKNSESVKGKGHSSHVTNIGWRSDDQMLFSVGGEDQTLLQWKINS